MKYAIAWVVLFLSGFMVFLNVNMDNKIFWTPYFIWDKGKDILAVAAFITFNRRLFWKLLPVLCFLIWRILWEPLAKILKVSINNQTAGNISFILLCLVYLWIFLNEHKRCRK